MTASGSAEEKLHWAFKMYDKDGSGFTNSLTVKLIVIGLGSHFHTFRTFIFISHCLMQVQ